MSIITILNFVQDEVVIHPFFAIFGCSKSAIVNLKIIIIIIIIRFL